jgi:hypothetical protein
MVPPRAVSPDTIRSPNIWRDRPPLAPDTIHPVDRCTERRGGGALLTEQHDERAVSTT